MDPGFQKVQGPGPAGPNTHGQKTEMLACALSRAGDRPSVTGHLTVDRPTQVCLTAPPTNVIPNPSQTAISATSARKTHTFAHQ